MAWPTTAWGWQPAPGDSMIWPFQQFDRDSGRPLHGRVKVDVSTETGNSRVRVAAVFLATSSIVGPAIALSQTTTQLRATNASAPKVYLVGPAGAKVGAISGAGFDQRTVWSRKDQNVRDLLSESSLHLNNTTVQALRKLNPVIRPDGTVPAGSKVTYFAPTFAAGRAAPADSKALVDMGSLAKYSVRAEVEDARATRERTRTFAAEKYERRADIQAHRQVVAQIESTAILVESKAERMNAKDLALSRYYLRTANQHAAPMSKSDMVISKAAVAELKSNAQPVQSMQLALRSGDSPFTYRQVVVKVVNAPGTPTPEPFQVYVLPSGLVADPATFSEKDIEQYLIDLSFEQLTTPSRSLVAQADMRLWIGPAKSYSGMARLVKAQQPLRFTRIDASPVGVPDKEIQFSTPIDIVRP